MKKAAVWLLVLLLLLPCTGFAEDDDPEEDYYSSEQFLYSIQEDGTALVMWYGDDEAEEVYVPASLDGHPVTVIGENTFAGMEKLTAVVLPDTVKEICPYAFYNCPELVSVLIPSSVTRFGERAFL